MLLSSWTGLLHTIHRVRLLSRDDWCLPRCWHVLLVPSVRASHYTVLGVPPSATTAQIKSAYYRQCKLHHPDRRGGDPRRFRRVCDSYRVLICPESRRRYDRRSQEPQAGFGVRHRRYRPRSAPSRPHMDFEQDDMARMYRKTGPVNPKLFNEDAWMRAHYSDLLLRRRLQKQMYSSYLNDGSRCSASRRNTTRFPLMLGRIFSLSCFVVLLMLTDVFGDSY